MALATSSKMKFVSKPYGARRGLLPMVIAMVGGWTLLTISLAAAGSVLEYDRFFGSMVYLISCGFGLFLLAFTFKWIKDGRERHELFVDGDVVALFTFDPDRGVTSREEMDLKNVTVAEYFTPGDEASMLLKGSNSEMEIPLWSFGARAEEKFVNYLKLRKVNILGVPNNAFIL